MLATNLGVSEIENKNIHVINPVVVVRTYLINYIYSGCNARIERLKFIY